MKNQISLESNEIQAHMLANSHSEIRLKCGLIRARKVLFFVLFCSCQENLLTLDNQSGLYDKVFYFLLLIFFPIIEADTKGAEPMSVDQEQKQDDKSKDPQATGTYVHSL